jgi:Uma2 family endonuclease
MATHTLMSAAQFDQLPQDEGQKWELLDGELIPVSSATPRHSFIVMELGHSLRLFLRRSAGVVLPDTEFAIEESRRLRPDLALLSAAQWAQVDQLKVPVTVMPDIAVEIVSPSESASGLERKVDAYLQAGIAEVWVVYPESRHVLVHSRASIRKLDESAVLDSERLPGWSLAVKELFSD